MRRRVLVLATVAASFGAIASNVSATTQPNLVVPIRVFLKPHAMTLSATRVNRGYYVEFGVRNRTAKRRVFSVAGRAISVPPRKLRFVAIMFGFRGKYRVVSRGAGTAIRATFRVS